MLLYTQYVRFSVSIAVTKIDFSLETPPMQFTLKDDVLDAEIFLKYPISVFHLQFLLKNVKTLLTRQNDGINFILIPSKHLIYRLCVCVLINNVDFSSDLV